MRGYVAQLAAELVLAFEALRALVGEALALVDERLQAARRRYVAARSVPA